MSVDLTRTFIFPIVNLQVDDVWEVGRARFQPSGWLIGRVRDLELAGPQPPSPADDWGRDLAGKVDTATADVEAGSADEAQDRVGAAVAVLRLFQRVRDPISAPDTETFGFRGEIASSRQDYWIADDNGPTLFGGEWHGVMGPRRFDAADRLAFPEDIRFAYLHHALKTESPSDLQNRATKAVRAWSTATLLLSEAAQLALAATALDALLGDRGAFSKARQVAERAGAIRGDGTRTKDAVRGVFEARNQALHEARHAFGRNITSAHLAAVEAVLLDTASWLSTHDCDTLAELDVLLGTTHSTSAGRRRGRT